jgi:peptide deformylase
MVKYYKGDLVEFEILKLVDFYSPILRQPTIPVKFDTLEEQKHASYLAFSLAETLNSTQGLGLSANQVGLRDRVCAINMGEKIWTMFNPEIIERSDALAEYSEGCLSYPGLYLKLDRNNHIKVRFQAIGGQTVEQEFDGLTAVCIQHEIDHLNGIVYTSKVSPIKLEQAKRKIKQNLKKMRKFNEEYARNQELLAQQEQQPKQEIGYKQPTIQIIDDSKPAEKQTEKFVYKVG